MTIENMMANYCTDRPQELLMQINDLHLSYLQMDDNLDKLQQRTKLEGCIREYLCLVPHSQKFFYSITADILHRSACTKEDFSGYRAANAWNAIGLYAANLIAQPWRKEYRELKLYCGFYKHEVEANLIGAERMLEIIGYQRVDQSTMVLEMPIDPVTVVAVSRDSLMAYVECQLLKQIWEQVSASFPCSWLDILEFREKYVEKPEKAVRTLIYRYHERQHQEQQIAAATYHKAPTEAHPSTTRYHQPSHGCLYGQVPSVSYGYCSSYPVGIPHSCPVTAQPRCALPPHQTTHVPFHVPFWNPTYPAYFPVLKSQDLYPNSGMGQPHYPGPMAMAPMPGMPLTIQNGYPVPNQMSAPANVMQNYAVPTAQLIELETSVPPSSESEQQLTYSTTDSSSSVMIPLTVRHHKNREPNVRNYESHNFINETDLHEPPPLSKTKDDGKGTYESWDFVYKNLESQGYSKDLAERPDVLSSEKPSISSYKNNNKENRPSHQYAVEMNELETTLTALRLEEIQNKHCPDPQPMKINEALKKFNMEDTPRNHPNKVTCADNIDGQGSVYDNMSSPPRDIAPSTETTSRLNLMLSLTPSKGSSKTSQKESRKHLSNRIMSGDNRDSTKVSNLIHSGDLIDNSIDHISAKMRTSNKTLGKDSRKSSNKNISNNIQYSSATLDLRKCSEYGNYNSQSHNSHKNNHKDSKKREDHSNKWACETCTFHNEVTRDVCEMCGKSKLKGSELKPLASGGRQCPKCTLINEKEVDVCVACESSLKDSPTYI